MDDGCGVLVTLPLTSPGLDPGVLLGDRIKQYLISGWLDLGMLMCWPIAISRSAGEEGAPAKLGKVRDSDLSHMCCPRLPSSPPLRAATGPLFSR